MPSATRRTGGQEDRRGGVDIAIARFPSCASVKKPSYRWPHRRRLRQSLRNVRGLVSSCWKEVCAQRPFSRISWRARRERRSANGSRRQGPCGYPPPAAGLLEFTSTLLIRQIRLQILGEFIVKLLNYHVNEYGCYSNLITNESVDIAGDVAHVEIYVAGLFSRKDNTTVTCGGRYVDWLDPPQRRVAHPPCGNLIQYFWT